MDRWREAHTVPLKLLDARHHPGYSEQVTVTTVRPIWVSEVVPVCHQAIWRQRADGNAEIIHEVRELLRLPWPSAVRVMEAHPRRVCRRDDEIDRKAERHRQVSISLPFEETTTSTRGFRARHSPPSGDETTPMPAFRTRRGGHQFLRAVIAGSESGELQLLKHASQC